MLLTVDVTQDRVNDFTALCKRNGIDICQFNPQGPAGGNARFTVIADGRERVLLVVDFYFGAVA